MYSENSPLESLFAFAIVFAAGMITGVGLAQYLEQDKAEAESSRSPSPES